MIGDVNKSVIADRDKKKKMNELYVDVFERLNCMMNLSGEVVSQSIDGTITMRSYLSGCPPVRMLLSENTLVGKDTPIPVVQDTEGRTLSADDFIILDDINFNGCMKLDKFDTQRLLCFNPPEGEFTAMNYRSTHSFFPPVSVQPVVEQVSEYKLDVVLKVTTNFSAELKCSELLVSFRTPRTTSSCKCELPDEAKKQTTDYLETKRLVAWRIADAEGQHEFFLHVIITLTEPCNAWTVRSMGPIAWAMAGAVTSRLNFTIMNMSLSGMAVRDVKVDKLSNDPSVPEALARGGGVMCRNQWIRYIVKSSSYVCRFS